MLTWKITGLDWKITITGTIYPVKSNNSTHVETNFDREEEFVREKVASKPFQGSGNVLGSIAPAVAPPAADASLDPKQVVYSCRGACTLHRGPW